MQINWGCTTPPLWEEVKPASKDRLILLPASSQPRVLDAIPLPILPKTARVFPTYKRKRLESPQHGNPPGPTLGSRKDPRSSQEYLNLSNDFGGPQAQIPVTHFTESAVEACKWPLTQQGHRTKHRLIESWRSALPPSSPLAFPPFGL